jgi:cysteinyl-tRNA synthetase
VARYGTKANALYRLLVKMDSVFGLDFDKAAEKPAAGAQELEPEIAELVDRRQQARKDKNWKLADEIRAQLNGMGYVLEDTAQGVKVTKA